jgi:hypothetical protein
MKSKIQIKFNKAANKKKEEEKDQKINNYLNKYNKAKIENKMKNFHLPSLNQINTNNK